MGGIKIMNRNDLKRIFTEAKLPNDYYSLIGGLPNEAFVISNYNTWDVYYSERGEKTGLVKFDTEEEACEYMYKLVKKLAKVDYNITIE
jgi:hypothetical protein